MAHETEKCYCVVSRKVWVWFSTRAINRLNIGKAHKTTFELLLKINIEEEPSSTDWRSHATFYIYKSECQYKVLKLKSHKRHYIIQP